MPVSIDSVTVSVPSYPAIAVQANPANPVRMPVPPPSRDALPSRYGGACTARTAEIVLRFGDGSGI
jgi:hypothetical protein